MAGLRWERIQFVRIRGLSACDIEPSYTLAVMDAADLNKILMIVKYDTSGPVRVLGIDGKELFTVAGLQEQVSTVYYRNEETGKVTLIDDEDAEEQGLLLEVNNMHHASNQMATIVQSVLPNSVIKIRDIFRNLSGEITGDTCPSVVDVTMSRPFPMEYKMVILALAIKCSISLYEIHNAFVPTLSKISVCSPDPDQNPYQVDDRDFGAASVISLNQKLRIRAAGYSSELDQIYFDIISPTSNKVILTAEFEPHYQKDVQVNRHGGKATLKLRGSFLVRNRDGIKAFSICGVLDDELSYLFSGRDSFQGYLFDKKFFDSKGKKFGYYCMEVERPESSTKVRVIEVYDNFYQKYAEIFKDKCVVELLVSKPMNVAGKTFMLFRALLAVVQTFGLHRKPLPDIRYLYRETSNKDRKAIV